MGHKLKLRLVSQLFFSGLVALAATQANDSGHAVSRFKVKPAAARQNS